jgi:sugar fermentation stimulation protein A
VYLAESDNPARKTAYDLIAVEKLRQGQPSLLVNMDAQAPNTAAAEWLPKSGLFSPEAVYRREVTHGNSRFDLYVEDGARRVFIEVKGVTLEREGIAYFPDAPTERGVKHLKELAAALNEGYEAIVLFVIQMKDIAAFAPNDEMHKAFGDALREAAEAGVRVLAMDCLVTPATLAIDAPVAVNLN